MLKRKAIMRQTICLFIFPCAVLLYPAFLESRTRKVPEAKAQQKVSYFRDARTSPVAEQGTTTADVKYEFDVEAKRKAVERLVAEAVDYFNKTQSIAKAFHAFSNDPRFFRGELYLFVYGMEGTCYAYGAARDRIWKNWLGEKDAYGRDIVREIISKVRDGGGWVTYEWLGATKVSYVQKISKDGRDYVLGCGFYPFSKEHAVIGLVKAGVALFNKTMKESHVKGEVFGLFGYPLGRFVSGDLYLYAMTFTGDIVAHGERYGLIGTNGWHYRDAQGKYVNREIIEKLKTSEGGIWVEYTSKRAPKKTYAEKVVDNKGTEYFIACGYYPDTKRNDVVDLVRKGYSFMKSHGLTEAAREFNDPDNVDFRYGDLYLFVTDLEGKCIAEGRNVDVVGQNLWDATDEDGRFFVRELIQKAKDGGGWVDYKVKGSFRSNYVELVDLGTGKYMIGAGLYPSTKLESMVLLAKSAADYLRSAPDIKGAMAEFTKPRGRFFRGDLSIFAMTVDGICLAFGDMYYLIWSNLSTYKDANGVPIIKLFNDTVMRGPGLVSYVQDNQKIIAYAEEVKKDGTSYIVSSRMFQ
jgi:signal transduction histidine kinase